MGEPNKDQYCLEQLQLLFASYFPDSTTRARAMRGLRSLVKELERAGVRAVLRLGGNFVTEEPDPDCMEVEVIVPADFYSSCSKEQRDILDWIRDDKTIKGTHLCQCRLRIGDVGTIGPIQNEFVIRVEPDALDSIRPPGERGIEAQ